MQLLFSFGGSCGTIALDLCSGATVGDALAVAAHRALGSTDGGAELIALHRSRQLPLAAPLSSTTLQHGSTVTVTSRLRGGGGDGGSTGAESRSSYLEMYASKKPDKVNPAEAKLARWTCCHLSGEPLNPPCVCDDLGNLYNKDALVSALLHKTMPAGLAHITGLRHVTELKLERNSGKAGSSKKVAQQAMGYEPAVEADFVCPITGLEFNGRFRFVVHRPSGQVVAERSLKEVPAAVTDLLGEGWSRSELLPLNPPEEEVQGLKEALLLKLQAEREKKKSKKAAKAAAAAGGAAAAGDAAAGEAGAADGTAADGDAVPKKRPAAAAAAGPGPAAAAAGDAAGGGASKRLKLPQGATSDVYKSLFTSSLKEKPKETYLCRAI